VRFRTDAPLTLVEAALPLVVMLGLFVAGMAVLEMGTELLIAVMLGASAVAGAVAARHGHGWDAIQGATGRKLADVLPMILILLAIGMLIATWVFSGTIPYLVYWGVTLVNPKYLLLTAFLATAIMSVTTGTSWGSAGTIGVALMGTAAALDAPLAATAGAVVSGAYFGDKMSPLSDTTNICAIGAGAQLYDHVRHMLYTAVPSFGAALVVYTVAAGVAPVEGGGMPDGARVLLGDLERHFRLHWLVLVPPALVVASIVRRVPPAIAMVGASVVAVVIGLLLQGWSAQSAVVAAVAGFRADMIPDLAAPTATVSDGFRTLVERGGLYSMANTLIVVIAAFLLAGALEASGALDLLIGRMLESVRGVFGLVAATMGSGAVTIALTSHAGVTALVVGELYQKAYAERGLAPVNLSRSLEDSVTVIEPIMPWTVTGVFMATTLGVATTSYLPWAVFCYGGPVCSLAIAALYRRTGFGITRVEVAQPLAATTV
jgi:NhaC family Na+:H+ antiporter